MGEVWLADELGPRGFLRQVAVKRLLATEGISDYARESFVAEAQVIARLDHPNIVRLIELGESDDRGLYLALEYVDGAAFDRVIRRNGPLSPAAIALVGREVARALDAVHTMRGERGEELGVVHRDVSPANILVGRDGRVRLSDFGVARIHGLGGAKTETGVFKGKLPYMPPEQALGHPFDGRADVFSLGITLIEGLLGGRLRKAETQGQLIAIVATEAPPRVLEVIPDAPPALAAALDASTTFRASERVPSAAAFAAMLQSFLVQLGPDAEARALHELRERVATASGPGPARQAWSVAVGGEPGTGPDRPGSSPSAGTVGPTTKGLSQGAGDAAAGRPPSRRAAAFGFGAALLVGLVGGGVFVVLREPDRATNVASSTPATSSMAESKSAPFEPKLAPSALDATLVPSTSVAPSSAPPESSSTTDRPTTRPLGPGPSGSGGRPPPSSPGGEAAGPGRLQVVVTPWGNVTVDGVPHGTTPIGPIALPPGPHTVTVQNPELGASRSQVVRVEAGKQATARFDLKRAE